MTSPRLAARAAALTTIAAAPALLLASCAKVLDVDSAAYVDAVETICQSQCDFAAKTFTSDCHGRIQDRLAKAPAASVSAWLKATADQACGNCDNLQSCYYLAPVCATDDCETSAECCGFASGAEVCFQGKCAAVDTKCRPTGDACGKDEDCCGSAYGMGTCEGLGAVGKGGRCVQRCDRESPWNCPGCCVYGTLDAANIKENVCLGREVQNQCSEGYCTPEDATGCPGITSCKELDSKFLGVKLYGCK